MFFALIFSNIFSFSIISSRFLSASFYFILLSCFFIVVILVVVGVTIFTNLITFFTALLFFPTLLDTAFLSTLFSLSVSIISQLFSEFVYLDGL